MLNLELLSTDYANPKDSFGKASLSRRDPFGAGLITDY